MACVLPITHVPCVTSYKLITGASWWGPERLTSRVGCSVRAQHRTSPGPVSEDTARPLCGVPEDTWRLAGSGDASGRAASGGARGCASRPRQTPAGRKTTTWWGPRGRQGLGGALSHLVLTRAALSHSNSKEGPKKPASFTSAQPAPGQNGSHLLSVPREGEGLRALLGGGAGAESDQPCPVSAAFWSVLRQIVSRRPHSPLMVKTDSARVQQN